MCNRNRQKDNQTGGDWQRKAETNQASPSRQADCGHVMNRNRKATSTDS